MLARENMFLFGVVWSSSWLALLVLKNATRRKVFGNEGKDLQIVYLWYLRGETSLLCVVFIPARAAGV